MPRKKQEPSGDVIPGESGPVSYPEDTPAVRAYSSCCERFAQMLLSLAGTYANRRGTTMVTDADVEDAYREITRPNRRKVFATVLGDFLLLAGGAFFGTLQMTFMGIGALLALAGFYIRECGGGK